MNELFPRKRKKPDSHRQAHPYSQHSRQYPREHAEVLQRRQAVVTVDTTVVETVEVTVGPPPIPITLSDPAQTIITLTTIDLPEIPGTSDTSAESSSSSPVDGAETSTVDVSLVNPTTIAPATDTLTGQPTDDETTSFSPEPSASPESTFLSPEPIGVSSTFAASVPNQPEVTFIPFPPGTEPDDTETSVAGTPSQPTEEPGEEFVETLTYTYNVPSEPTGNAPEQSAVTNAPTQSVADLLGTYSYDSPEPTIGATALYPSSGQRTSSNGTSLDDGGLTGTQTSVALTSQSEVVTSVIPIGSETNLPSSRLSSEPSGDENTPSATTFMTFTKSSLTDEASTLSEFPTELFSSVIVGETYSPNPGSGAAGDGAGSSDAATSTAPETRAIVGGVVGGVAGLAAVLLLLLVGARWWRRRDSQRLDDEPKPRLLAIPALAKFKNRRKRQPPNLPPPPPPEMAESSPQKSFQRLGGRKLPSQFSPGMIGPGPGSVSHPSSSGRQMHAAATGTGANTNTNTATGTASQSDLDFGFDPFADPDPEPLVPQRPQHDDPFADPESEPILSNANVRDGRYLGPESKVFANAGERASIRRPAHNRSNSGRFVERGV